MTIKHPFQCSECSKEMLLELSDKHRIMCEDCTTHQKYFNDYLTQFEAELPFPDKQWAISRIIEYSYTINHYADKLGINRSRNKKFFEKFIGLASNKLPSTYEYQKLKSDVYDQCNFVIREEDDKIERPAYQYGESFDSYEERTRLWSISKNTISEQKRKHMSVLELIENPAEYLNILKPSNLPETQIYGIFKHRIEGRVSK